MAGEMARQLRTLVSFVEDLGLVPSIHGAAHNTSSRGFDTVHFLTSKGTRRNMVYIHTHRQNMHIRKSEF